MTPKLWHWPAVLGLDAPVVAGFWYMLLTRSLTGRTGPLLWPLGFAVWAMYLADRLVDLHLRPPDTDRTIRHRWARNHGKGFTLALAIMATLAVVTAIPHWQNALLFPGAGVALYGMIFVWPRRSAAPSQRWFKKIACGILFALGVFTAAAGEQGFPAPATLLTGMAFAALCTANCLLIATREGACYDSLPSMVAPVACALGAAFLLALAGMRALPRIAGAEMVSVLLLLVLLVQQRRITPDTMRGLADGSLLTPVLFLVFS